MLLTTAARPEWATGPVLSIDGNEYHEKWALERAADVAVLPPELSAYLGMTVDLYGPAGPQCRVVLDTLTIEAHLPMEYADGDYAKPGAEALW
ncbi:MAG TPA: hypothetical protein VK034_21820, partial [Enhygromyxa sp.]|nr:hypothetical protein [Enhygromyxa sp.]